MDIGFKQGPQTNFNTSVFTEGDICFVNQSDSNDYIYRIGPSGAKIGIIGDGYLINDTEFKILKPIINSNNVKIGDMISATAGTSSYEVPSIIGYNATTDGLISNRYLMLDIGDNTSGAIIPNPNKDIDLGLIDARWNTIYTENILVNKYYYSKTNTSRAISIDECTFNESLIYPMIQGFGSPGHKMLALDGGASNLEHDIHIVPNPERTGIKHLGHEANTLRWKLFSSAITNSGDIDNSGKITTKTLSVNSNYINGTTAVDGVGVVGSFHPNAQNECSLGWDLRRWKSMSVGSGGINISHPNPDYHPTAKFQSVLYPTAVYWSSIAHPGMAWSVKDASQTKTKEHWSVCLVIENWVSDQNLAAFVPTDSVSKTSVSKVALGNPSKKWRAIYAKEGTVDNTQGTGVAITSDKRLKTIENSNILNANLEVYDSLEPVCYKYKNVIPEDNFSRTHVGFLAQDVAAKIEEVGLTNQDCALIQSSPIEEDAPQELKDICTDGYKHYLNYNELHGLHTLKNHQQDDRLAALEAKNKELENTISELKTQIELFKLAIGG